MAQGRLLSLRLFLEGIEVDIVSAQVTAGISQPCTAQIEIPSAAAAHRILPRTLVHLFYLESTYEAPSPESKVGPVNTFDPQDLAKWKLLFAGEILSMSFVKAGGSRGNYLMCQDFSSYWQAAQLYWGTGNNSQNSYKKVIMMGATQVRTGATKVHGGGALANLLSAKPTSNPTLSGVLGGIVSLLEAATGVYQGKGKENYRGVNDFLSQAEVRLHLTRMIGAHPDDDTSATYVNSGDLRTYFQRLTSSVKSTASFMDLTNVFLSKIHHQWASVPAPPYMEQGLLTIKRTFPSGKKLGFGKELDGVVKDAKGALQAIEDRLTEVNRRGQDTGVSDNAVAIKSNGNIVLDGAKHKTFAADPKIVKFAGESTLPAGTSVDTDAMQKFAKLSVQIADDRKSKAPKTSVMGITTGLGAFRQAAEVLAIVGSKDSKEDYPEHTYNNLVTAKNHLLKGLGSMTRGAGIPMVVKATKGTANPQLNMFLFTPDLYMVPPPRCNVLFPDQYMSVNFSRSWMSEITRLWMFGQTTAGRETSVGYFSPNTSILAGPKARDAAKAAGAGLSFLMDHEIFSGPIPAIEALGDIGVFKKLHQANLASLKKGKKDKSTPDATGSSFTGQARYSPQEHLQRAANYLFFAKRFEGRTMAVEARFSPQLVPGLPLLLLDPVEGQSSLQLGKSSDLKGTHYVGTIATISHTLNASGGAGTSIQLVKCRAHNEGVDLFDPSNEEGVERVEGYDKRIGVVRKKTKILAIYRKTIGDDPKAENFLRPETLADQAGLAKARYNNSELISDRYDNKYGTTGAGKFVRDSTRVTKNGHVIKIRVEEKEMTPKELLAGNNNQFPVAPEQGSPPGMWLGTGELYDPSLTNTKYEVTTAETRKATKHKALTFTFEATATPPWFANIYLPYNVGQQYYTPMLGCGSVLDEAVLDTKSTISEGPGKEVTYTIKLPSKDGSTLVEVPVPLELTRPALSTHSAAEQLADVWLGLQQSGANIPLFVETYTARKHATLLDIFGNNSMTYLAPKDGNLPAGNKVGFHENAFGWMGAMETMEGEPLLEEAIIQKIATKGWKPPIKRAITPKADPRATRYGRIRDYVEEVSKLRGSLNGK